VNCAEARPNCPVARVSPWQYGIGGNGFAGEGFQAILGISLRSPRVYMGADNPLRLAGIRRWIVILPRPGEGSGHLIINPTPSELAGFKPSSMRMDSGGTMAQVRPFWSYAVLFDASRGVTAIRPRS
jgi:hypothetical protein